MFESEAFAASGPPQNLFVLDDQTHMVRFTQTQGRSLRAIAQGPGPASTAAGFLRNPNNSTGALDELGNAWTPWNPLLGQTPNTGSEFHLAKYIQRFFLESQVTVSILSNANLGSIPVAGEPNRPPKTIAESLGAENLTGHMTAGVRDFVNQIAGSTRMLAHGQLYPGVGNLHDPVYGDYTPWQIDTFHPDSGKGDNTATAAKLDFNPESVMARWRLNDELVAYPIYEVIARNKQELRKHPGFWNICVHKGLAPGPPDVPERGDGHPEGGRGLAAVQLHHLPLLHPQRVLRSRLSRNDQVRTDAGRPGSGGAGHQLDDAVRRAVRAVPERVRPARHDLRWLGRHVPHAVRSYHRPAPEDHVPRPHRVRVGLTLVRRFPRAGRPLSAGSGTPGGPKTGGATPPPPPHPGVNYSV